MVVIFIPGLKICGGIVTSLCWNQPSLQFKSNIHLFRCLWWYMYVCAFTHRHTKGCMQWVSLKLWWGNDNHSVFLMLAGNCKIFLVNILCCHGDSACVQHSNDSIVIQESIGSSAQRGLLFRWGMWLFRWCLAALLAEVSQQLLILQFNITCGVDLGCL